MIRNGKLGNYSVTTNDGLLNVTAATLTVSAANQSRPFSAPNPILAWGYSGFVNGETSKVVSGIPDLSTTADSNSPQGT